MHPTSPLPSWAEFIDGLEIYVDPIVCGVIAGLVLGLLGVYVVLRRMAFIPLAITHGAGFGVALAFYAQIHLGAGPWADPVLGAFGCGLAVTALLLMMDPRRLGLTSGSLIGLIYISTAGAAVLLGSRISQEAHEIGSIIFGTAVMVSKTDLYVTLGVGAFVLALHAWLRRGMVYASFDPDGARVQRLPVRLLDTLLLLSTGLMIAVTTRALGAMPVFAFSVLPAMTALSLVRSLHLALAVAAAVGALSALIGYVASFFLLLPVGASQTLVAAVFATTAIAARRIFTRRAG